MVDFFRTLLDAGLLTAAFILGALAVFVAVIGKIGVVLDIRGWRAVVVGVIGGFFVCFAVSGFVLVTVSAPPSEPALVVSPPVQTGEATPASIEATVPRSLVEELAQKDETPVSEVHACLDRVHAAFRHIEFEAGQTIPGGALVATNFWEAGRRWSEFPVRPVCHSGDWGLFESTSAYQAPYKGAYWTIVP